MPTDFALIRCLGLFPDHVPSSFTCRSSAVESMLPCSPSQIRTCTLMHAAPASGHDGKPYIQPAVSAPPPVTRFPVSMYGTCFGFASSLWPQPFPRSTPPRPAPFCSSHSTVLWLLPIALPYSSSDSDCLLSFSDIVNATC